MARNRRVTSVPYTHPDRGSGSGHHFLTIPQFGGPIMDTKTARIRALNDQLRQHFTGGMAVITPGVAALGPEAVERIVKTIAVFDDFCRANDPYEERDLRCSPREQINMRKVDGWQTLASNPIDQQIDLAA